VLSSGSGVVTFSLIFSTTFRPLTTVSFCFSTTFSKVAVGGVCRCGAPQIETTRSLSVPSAE
jgi:hypothetical protein